MPSFLSNIGPTEIIIIGLILIFLFGAKKIVEFGKGAGEATKEIKKIKKEFTGAVDDAKSDKPEEEDKQE